MNIKNERAARLELLAIIIGTALFLVPASAVFKKAAMDVRLSEDLAGGTAFVENIISSWKADPDECVDELMKDGFILDGEDSLFYDDMRFSDHGGTYNVSAAWGGENGLEILVLEAHDGKGEELFSFSAARQDEKENGGVRE